MLQNPVLIAIAVTVACLIGTVVMWIVVTAVLRRIAKMDRELGFDPGVVLRKSGYGSARINGVNASGCVYIVEYEKGWAIGLMRIFGRGVIFLPKGETRWGSQESDGASWLASSEQKKAEYARHKIHLYGNLAEFIRADEDKTHSRRGVDR